MRFCCFLGVLFVGAGAAAQSVELGPAPTDGFGGATGRVSALACSHVDANLYYAAGADGGVWKTTNGGGSWTPLTDFAPTTAVGALALHPQDDRVLYVGLGEANFANHSRAGFGVLKTTDGGATWSVLAEQTFAGRCFSRMVIDPVTPSTLYAAVTRAGGFPTMAAAKGHPQATGPTGVFKSVDSGVTWAPLSGGLPGVDVTDLAIDHQNPATVYAAVGLIFGHADNGIYKSVDAGVTWARLGNGAPSGAVVGRLGLAVSKSHPQRMYANAANPADAAGGSATYRGTWRSVDGGATWTGVAASVNTSTYGWYFGCIGVHPTNPDVVFVGGIDARLTTNGSTFQSMSGEHPDHHAVAWDAAGRLLSGNDGGVYRAAGTVFTPINGNLGVTQFYAGLSTSPASEHVVIGGLQDNGTVLRTGPTTSWSMRVGGDGGWTQIDQANPMRMFAESQGTGMLRRSENGGASFAVIGSGLTGRNCFLPPYLLDPATPGRMLYATERVWVSTNYGTSFTPLSADLTGGGTAAIRSLAIAPSDSRYVYAATNDGRVLYSADWGASFTVIRSNNPGWPRVTRELCVDPRSPTTLYLAVAAYGTEQVIRTSNMGAEWEALDAGLPDVPVNVVVIDPRSSPYTLYVGTDAGLYTSTSEGAAWRRIEDIPSTAVIDVVMEPGRSRLVIGTQGRGAWAVPAARYCSQDFDGDGDSGTDADIEAFFACLAGSCCAGCTADFNNDGDVGTDLDIEAFFRVLAGAGC